MAKQSSVRSSAMRVARWYKTKLIGVNSGTGAVIDSYKACTLAASSKR